MLNKYDNLQWNIIFITRVALSSGWYNLVGSITFSGWGLCKTDQFASIAKENLKNYLVHVAFLFDQLAWRVRWQVPLRTNNSHFWLALAVLFKKNTIKIAISEYCMLNHRTKYSCSFFEDMFNGDYPCDIILSFAMPNRPRVRGLPHSWKW